MNPIVNRFVKFVQKPQIQKLANWASQPHIAKKIDEWTPPIEAAYITGWYLVDIYASKDIPEARKNPLAWNSLICMVGGIFGGIALSKITKPFQNAVCDHIEKSNIHKKDHIIKGIKTLVPLLSVSLMIRYILPVIATPASVWVNNILKKLGLAKEEEQTK